LLKGFTAIDALHFLVSVYHEQDRWVSVHESQMSNFDFETPELQQVLGSRELEQK